MTPITKERLQESNEALTQKVRECDRECDRKVARLQRELIDTHTHARNIPSHWEIVPFKRLVDIRNGRDHKEIEQETGYPVCKRPV